MRMRHPKGMWAGLLCATLALSPGEPMPPLRGDELDGRTAVLPDAARGRVALIVFAFSLDSRTTLEQWAARFDQDFGADSAITVFGVPMLSGLARLARGVVEGLLRRNVPLEMRDQVITVTREVRDWRRRLGLEGAGDAGLVLLDHQGIVSFVHAGPFAEDAYVELAGRVHELMPMPLPEPQWTGWHMGPDEP
jgi:hypothetical protein